MTVMCMMGAMVVKASMLSFQEVQKHSTTPPARDITLRTRVDSCQFRGSAMAATSLVKREVSWQGQGREGGRKEGLRTIFFFFFLGYLVVTIGAPEIQMFRSAVARFLDC